MSRTATPRPPSILQNSMHAPQTDRTRVNKTISPTDIVAAAVEDLRLRSGRVSFSYMACTLIEEALQARGIDPYAYAPAGAGSLPLPAAAIAAGKVPDPNPGMAPVIFPDIPLLYRDDYRAPGEIGMRLDTGTVAGFLCVRTSYGGQVIAYGPDNFRWLATIVQPGDLHPERLSDAGQNPHKHIPHDTRTGQLQRMIWFLSHAGYRRISNLLWLKKKQHLMLSYGDGAVAGEDISHLFDPDASAPASDNEGGPDQPLPADETRVLVIGQPNDGVTGIPDGVYSAPAGSIPATGAGDDGEEELLPNDPRVIDELMKVGKR